MLLVHQAGTVKIGEIVRYTLTYTPSNDRILPTPTHLHLKVKNTAAIPLRAAWLHGPYALHVAAYPATFNPHRKVENPKRDGVPEYEPMLKASGSWQAKLTVPDDIRETGADLGKRKHNHEDASPSVTWIIEIASQILFSNSASISFEMLVGRDERSLDLGFAAVAGAGHGVPGQLKDQQMSEKVRQRARRQGNVQVAGVYSKAVKLVVEDTETLWDKPALPRWEDEGAGAGRESTDARLRDGEKHAEELKPKKQKNIHLVVLTHGLHSNLGADMLFMKESIDATVAQARVDAKKRKDSYRAQQQGKQSTKETSEAASDGEKVKDDGTDEPATAPLSGGQEDLDDDDDEEQTIVRGFTGNAVRTENGIQYLGKRLAKYILRMTYPDQPFLPIKKPLSRTLTDPFIGTAGKAKRDGAPVHSGSSIHHPPGSKPPDDRPYKYTSISFVGHSLGGLVQTYAVAYIHKHSPTFFQVIKPVNFISMASPMLGLSNENPMYVKFALDFGLVGRTGRDLGLTWKPPNLTRDGWNAMLGGLGTAKDTKKEEDDPSAKPLLRILPTGPAHQVLKLFRNRTVYSNVVNDGIVPLRTSCLLFLDWRGLGKVDKARRENGLIGTVAEWGWAEITGANSSSVLPDAVANRFSTDEDEDTAPVNGGEADAVPQPAEDETEEDGRRLTTRMSYDSSKVDQSSSSGSLPPGKQSEADKGMFDSFLGFFRTAPEHKPIAPTSKKTTKALHRGQTIHHDQVEEIEESLAGHGDAVEQAPKPANTGHRKRPLASRGDSLLNAETGELQAPPKTSVFESAADIMKPPLPSRQWLTDPSTRARTIFHDRVYHPEDIPPPPVKRPGSRLTRSFSSDNGLKNSTGSLASMESTDSGSMKVEEKIARAYHRDLSWRKVLVRIEPDAHNNIIVRRMFANAYGWPVVKHLCDTHFGDTFSARTRDEEEPARERAQPMDKPVPETGEEVANQTSKKSPERTQSETRESRDELADLSVSQDGAEMASSSAKRGLKRQNSNASIWDDALFEEGSDDDNSDVDERTLVQRLMNPMSVKKPEPTHQSLKSTRTTGLGSSPLSPAFTDGHRGLAPTSPTSSRVVSVTKPVPAAKSAASDDPIDDPVISDRLVDEPESTDTSVDKVVGNTAVLGLRSSTGGL